jgi:hypothetical protein
MPNCSPRNYSTPETPDYSGVAVELCRDWTRFGLSQRGDA